MALPALTIRPLAADDLDWAAAFLSETLGGRLQARRGELVDVLEGGPGRGGLVAVLDRRSVGLLTWVATPPDAEVRAVAVTESARGKGVGGALLTSADKALRDAGVARAWLVTTNDNLTALALYQKAGWRLTELRAGAIDDIRRSIKPSIPAIGMNGIPLRDELELTKAL